MITMKNHKQAITIYPEFIIVGWCMCEAMRNVLTFPKSLFGWFVFLLSSRAMKLVGFHGCKINLGVYKVLLLEILFQFKVYFL
jgi:hypothetical protein